MSSRRDSTARVRSVVIQDLDGATPEPTRRRHVVALSIATAVASLALLVGLYLLPSRFDAPPLAASTAASATSGPRLIMSRWPPISHMRIDLSRPAVCSDGTRLTPPYAVSRDADTGRVFVANHDDLAGERLNVAVPVTFRFDVRTGFMTVTCATDDLPSRWEPGER
jgi:hypothetical protein